MEYNTQLPKLVFSEYGRNVQRMVDHVCAIKDKKDRNNAAVQLIQIMGQMNPHLKDIQDFNQKLWDHLFVMSDFSLDVDSPYPKPTKEAYSSKPEKVNYPNSKIKYKHYGIVLQGLIEEACKFEEGDKKKYFVELLANLMKRHYLNFNRDSVNDEVIAQHLKELSKGQLTLNESFTFKHTNEILGKNPNNQHNKRKHKKNFHGKNQNFRHRK